ncbi:MAG: hypothetical protein MI861_14705, partial [Pirellulales bacterium]|nr:hypothetical protein [Pirellulales bacterium]
TQSGEFLGTLRYMAPERFRDECDERADIYGLGLTLYELIAMQPAFQSSDRLRLIGMINKTDPPRLRSLNPRVPRDLETIVSKAIDKDPRSRYQSAEELVDDLRRYLTDQPIKARRHSLFERIVRWSRKNKGLSISLFSIAVLVILGLLGLGYASINETRLRRAAEDAEAEAQSALKLAQQREQELETQGKQLQQKSDQLTAQSRELQQNLYSSEMNLAGQTLGMAGGMQQLFDIVERWEETPSDDFRGWEWYYLRSVMLDEGVSLPGFRLRSAAWSPDGSQVATTGSYDVQVLKEVFIRNASTGELIKTLRGHQDAVLSVAWDANKNRIASASSDRTIRIWNPVTGVCLRTIGPLDSKVSYVAWDPPGEQLALMTEGGRHDVYVLDMKSDNAAPIPLPQAGVK